MSNPTLSSATPKIKLSKSGTTKRKPFNRQKNVRLIDIGCLD
jgi:hypothetical protein